MALHRPFQSVVAQVVEASIVTGRPVLHESTAGVQFNPVVNPCAVEARVQGGTLTGLGMDEPGLPPLAPAFANALARLTGKPIRMLPFAQV